MKLREIDSGGCKKDDRILIDYLFFSRGNLSLLGKMSVDMSENRKLSYLCDIIPARKAFVSGKHVENRAF
jgi:hypothetical protein